MASGTAESSSFCVTMYMEILFPLKIMLKINWLKDYLLARQAYKIQDNKI